jgi:hypothetical protein
MALSGQLECLAQVVAPDLGLIQVAALGLGFAPVPGLDLEFHLQKSRHLRIQVHPGAVGKIQVLPRHRILPQDHLRVKGHGSYPAVWVGKAV